MRLLLIALLLLLLTTGLSAVTTVKKVDLQKYLGRWYQFAWYPNKFQPKDAALSSADYSMGKKNKIIVTNTSYKDKAGTEILKQVTGKAYAVDETNARLKVTFFWPFYGDYWIVKLDRDYQYSVVSDGKQKYLWILSRQPVMTEESYHEILQFLDRGGWDISRIEITGTLQ
jgi:apolipoprotein D and lipocalin family protein